MDLQVRNRIKGIVDWHVLEDLLVGVIDTNAPRLFLGGTYDLHTPLRALDADVGIVVALDVESITASIFERPLNDLSS